jgi:uncharacterized protein YhaN
LRSNDDFFGHSTRQIGQLHKDIDNIYRWVKDYKQEQAKGGRFARGIKMLKNVGKKHILGKETSFDQLLKMVQTLEETLKDMQVVAQLEIHKSVDVVVQEQQTMMMKVDEILNRAKKQVLANLCLPFLYGNMTSSSLDGTPGEGVNLSKIL